MSKSTQQPEMRSDRLHYQLQAMTAQRDELLAALENAVGFLDRCGWKGWIDGSVAEHRALIARVRGTA